MILAVIIVILLALAALAVVIALNIIPICFVIIAASMWYVAFISPIVRKIKRIFL